MRSFTLHRTAMTDFHKQWALNLAWVRGHQNVDYDNDRQTFIKSNKQPWQTRLISNKLLPILRNNVARLLQTNPIWDVVPATPDEEDIQIASTSTKVAQHLWYITNMRMSLLRTLFWQSGCGNAFLKVGWDSTIGPDEEINSNDVTDDLMQQFLYFMGIDTPPEKISVKAGEVFIDPVAPFNMALDPSASVFSDSDWSIESQIHSLDWMCNRYGNKWKDKLQITDEIQAFLYPQVFDKQRQVKKGVLQHELFVRRNKKFPKGLTAIVASDKIIKLGENPFEHGELPYTHFMEIYDPASFWATCDVEQVRPNQAVYNSIRSTIVDTINQVGKVQWVKPRQANAEITNRPGAVIEYTYPFKPEQTQPRPLPSYYENTLERTSRDIQDTSSQHDVSHGKTEPGLRSGKSILALQDRDDFVHATSLVLFDISLSRVGKLVLQTAAQHISEERAITITGEYDEQETLTFIGSDLRGESGGDYFKVRLKNITNQSVSRIARQGQIRELTEMGYLRPDVEQHRQFVLGVLGLGESLVEFEQYASERTRQFKEIQLMSQGQQVNVTLGEHHDTHVAMIKKFIASGKRDKLEPQALQMIQKHLDHHMEMKAIEMTKEALYMRRAMLMMGENSGGGTENRGSESGSEKQQARHRTKESI